MQFKGIVAEHHGHQPLKVNLLYYDRVTRNCQVVFPCHNLKETSYATIKSKRGNGNEKTIF